MTILLNLIQILFKAPQIIGIVKAILDIVGSAQVQNLLEAIRDALKKEVTAQGTLPETESDRAGLFKRVIRRWALSRLNMSEGEYAHFCAQSQERSYV